MQRPETLDCPHHLGRKQAHECRNDARKLRVPLAEVRRTVKLFKEKLRGSSVARAGQQVGIRLTEPLLLIVLDAVDLRSQRRVGCARRTLGRHARQMGRDRDGVIHDRSG